MGIQCAICEELLESGADAALSLLPSLEEPTPTSSSRGSRNKSRKSLPEPASPKDIVSTLCGHLFHAICLQNWFKNGSTCPACRKFYAKSKLIKIFLSLPSEEERDVEKELADVKELLDLEHKDKDELKLELEALQLQFTNKSEQLDKKLEEIANIQVILFKSETQYKESICKIDKLRENQSHLTTQVSVLTEEKERLIEHKNDLLNQITALEEKNKSDLESSLKIRTAQQEKISRLEAQNFALMDKCKLLERNQGALKTQLEVVSEERDNLSKQDEDLLKRIEAQKESDGRKISQLSGTNSALMAAYEGLLDRSKSVLVNEMANYQRIFASPKSRCSSDSNDVLEIQKLSNQNALVETTGPVNKRTGEDLKAHFSGDLKKRRVDDLTDERTKGVDDVAVLEDVSMSNVGTDSRSVIPCSELFENDKIMSSLVSKLPKKQLPELRLTCNTWDNNAIIEVLGESHEKLRFCNSCSSAIENQTSLADLLLTLNSQDKVVLCGKYQINGGSIYQDRDKYFLTNLVTMFGHFLTVLKITAFEKMKMNLLTISDLKKIIFNMTPVLRELEILDHHTQNRDSYLAYGSTSMEQTKYNNKTLTLKKLTLQSKCSSEVAYVGFSNFLAELFRACANLELIEIIMNGFNTKKHKDVNMPVLLLLCKLPNLDKLKSVIMQNVSNNELKQLVNLFELGLKLSSFDTYGMKRSTLNVNLLNDFLKVQAASLRKLNVRFDHEKLVNTVVTIHLPKMLMLEEFNYSIGRFNKGNIEFESETLALNFPNLKAFALLNQGFIRNNAWSKFMCLKNEHHGVKVLHVDGICTADRMLQLVKLFPSTRKLKAKLTATALHTGNIDRPKQALSQVWNWAGLESLHLNAFILRNDTEFLSLDEIITGIPTEKHEDLKRLLSSGVNHIALDKLKSQPGISDLKNLYEFRLDIRIYSATASASASITDISWYHGLAFAKRLRYLSVFPGDGISSTCQTAIQNALGPNAFIRIQKEK